MNYRNCLTWISRVQASTNPHIQRLLLARTISQAPITIENKGYVAAGSTVNRDVPASALAIGRARQVNKEDYRERLDSRMRKESRS